MVPKRTFVWMDAVLLILLLSSCGNPTLHNRNMPDASTQLTKTLLNITATLQTNGIFSNTTVEPPSNELQTSPTACETSIDFNSLVLTEVGGNKDSCLPDQTNEGVGIYILDLDNQDTLVSINSDIPFQFGSSFKAPLLVYFLSNCGQYWDTSSSEWQDHFRKQMGNDDAWYSSQEYEQIIRDYLTDVNHWGEMQDFTNQILNGYAEKVSSLDRRFDILEQVYKMVTESNNIAAGNVLNFVFENCLSQPVYEIDPNCGGPNAITEFNHWFNEFSQIEYMDNEIRRGLHSWDTITIVDGNGIISETRLPTYAIQDACVLQGAFLGCSNNDYVNNTWTARDLGDFYISLFNSDEPTVRETAFEILKVDKEGNSRGLLKNLSRKLGTAAISKNGFDGYTIADAGILEYRDKNFVVVTLSYNALDSMNKLYGLYNLSGEPAGEMEGLIEQILLQKFNYCAD